LEYPKSQILRRGAGEPSSRVFSSFRSRWTTPWGAEGGGGRREEKERGQEEEGRRGSRRGECEWEEGRRRG
jgi:hypothetical protein